VARQRQAKKAAQDSATFSSPTKTALERQLGQPRENPAMQPRGGTVRENDVQRQARKRRERASVSPGGRPASRAETGF
jgi:hypothetical protein